MITNNPNGNQFWQIPSASIQVLFGPLVVHNVGLGNTIAQTLSQTQIHGLRLLSSVKCHFHVMRFYSALLKLFSPGPLHQSPSNWSVPSPFFLNQNHLTPDFFAATPWFAEIKRWLAKIPPIDKSGKGQAGYWWCDHWWWCQWFTCCVTSVASPPPPPCPPPLIWRQSLSIVHQPLLPQLTEHRPPRSSQSL